MAFARHQFELSKPQKDGTPLYAHLQAVSEKLGKPHPMLVNGPELPPPCSQLWIDFLELHGSRGSSGFAAQRITFADIMAWQTVRHRRLDQWDIDLIRKVDDLWLSEFMPRPKEPVQ